MSKQCKQNEKKKKRKLFLPRLQLSVEVPQHTNPPSDPRSQLESLHYVNKKERKKRKKKKERKKKEKVDGGETKSQRKKRKKEEEEKKKKEKKKT
jgi:hypothetical protein